MGSGRVWAAVVCMVVASGAGWAKLDAAQQASSIVKLENDRVRVLEQHYPAGAAGNRHTHAYPRVIYALDDGRLELISEDGDTARVDVKAGETIWRGPETHTVRNIGDHEVRLIETEIK